MTKPDDIPQDVWESANRVVGGPNVFVASSVEETMQRRIAYALMAAKKEGFDEIERDIMSAVEPYTRVGSLHNYGPGGLSREERTEIRVGTFIFEDLQAIFAALHSKAK